MYIPGLMAFERERERECEHNTEFALVVARPKSCSYFPSVSASNCGLKCMMMHRARRHSAEGVRRWGSVCSNWVRHCYIWRGLWHPVVALYLSTVVPPFRHRIRAAPGESEEDEEPGEEHD